MTTLFISDLHLDASRPAATRAFLAFLDAAGRDSEALFILGDLFEAWLGDDDPDPHHATVIDALRKYTATGRRCAFIHGNRDFLVGDAFGRRTGVELLADATVIEAYGQRVMLMHGDALCTDDLAYQRFRRFVRNPLLLAVFHRLPLGARQRLGAALRSKSVADTGRKADTIMDVNQGAVETAMRDAGVDLLMHGHTHRPGIHDFELDGRHARRIVLGDWYTQGSVLRWRPDGLELTALPFPASGD